MDISLVKVTAEGSAREIPLDKFPMTIGRDERCKLRIPASNVSRTHCELDIDDEELVVRDNGSSNGTYVNGERVRERELIPGDLLSIGPIVLVVKIDGHPGEIDARDCFAAGAVSTSPGSNDGVPAWSDNAPASAEAPKGHGMGSLVEGDPDDSDEFDFDLDLDDDDL